MPTLALITANAQTLRLFRTHLVAALVARGVRVLALAPNFDDDSRALVRSLGAEPVDCRLQRTGLNPVRDVLDTLHLARLLRRLRPDVVLGYAAKPVIYGSMAARLAGVPHPVLVRAHEIQARLEVSDINQHGIGQNILGDAEKRKDEQVNLFDYRKTEIINELQTLDVMALTPMDAINKLFLLREKARKL